jgi:hypothetical protein
MAPARAARIRKSPAPPTSIARAVAIARRRWALEVGGPLVHQLLRVVSSDGALTRAVRSGSAAAVRAAVNARFRSDWYHHHVSRLRVVEGGKVVVDVGVPFVVQGSATAFRDARGRTVATLTVSEQDVIGFVRFLKRLHGIDTVVRGAGAGHVRTSKGSARRARLPARGTVTLDGRRYAVGSFAARAFGGEPVTVWVLVPA